MHVLAGQMLQFAFIDGDSMILVQVFVLIKRWYFSAVWEKPTSTGGLFKAFMCSIYCLYSESKNYLQMAILINRAST